MIQPTNTQQAYPQPGGANAVSINIYNPQAYGSAPNAQAQQVPYQYQYPLYQMPQASVYDQQYPQAGYYQQYLPMQSPAQLQTTQQFQMPQMPVLMAPAPQVMPNSVMPQQDYAQVQTQEPAQVEVQQAPEQPQAPVVDTDALVQGLKDADADKRADAINKIAVYAQEAPDTALQVVSEPIMNSLIDVIKEDTSKLEGPTEQQIAVAEKITKGEKLTPEEDALSEQLSPRDKANKNRIFALYTLAMIQKLQRDELNQYIETQKANGEQPIQALNINDLAGYNEIVDIIKNDNRPEVKVAAIQALGYVAQPEDKAVVDGVLADSLKSTDDVVKNAAQEAVDKLNTTQQ